MGESEQKQHWGGSKGKLESAEPTALLQKLLWIPGPQGQI